MGALDAKVFQAICKEKFSMEEADVKATLLCSEWEEHLRNSDWHPFKVIMVNDKEMEILREDDEKLDALNDQWGDAAYQVVKTAFLELNEYNPSGRYVVPELWNNKKGRKDSIGEVIEYVLQQWKTIKAPKKEEDSNIDSRIKSTSSVITLLQFGHFIFFVVVIFFL